MNILYVDYTLKYKSLDIYISGCKGNPHCEGCHNPETWNFNQGDFYNDLYFQKNIFEKYVNHYDNMIDNIMIFGGEPLDSNHNELIKFLTDLNTLNKKIWLFTRFELDEIPDNIKIICDYIKTGKYIPQLSCKNVKYFGINLATANQKIHKTK